MSTYYWLGVTGACGNVNNPANWTLWAPNGACGFLPPSAATGPTINDTVIFTKFTVSGACYGVNYYPQVSPLGQLYGRTGAAATQHLNLLVVREDCPVVLGSSDSYFKFNATNINLYFNDASILPENSNSYINVGRGNSTYAYPSISVTNTIKKHIYDIKGTIRNIGCSTFTGNSNKPTVNLNGVTIKEFISLFSSTTGNPTTAIFNLNEGCGGTFDIFDNFSNGSVINIAPGVDVSYPNIISLNAATLNFVAPGYSGSDGYTYPRTDINLSTYSNVKSYPNIFVNHYVDFGNLRLAGGSIYFYAPEEISSVVQQGRMVASNSRIIANAGSVSINGGQFIVVGDGTSTSAYTPDISLKGNWALDLIPSLPGVSG